jgi:hypothetical protein
VDDVERPDDPDVVDEVGEVAGPPAAIEVADEGGTTHRSEDEVRTTEGDGALRVARVEAEVRRREGGVGVPTARSAAPRADATAAAAPEMGVLRDAMLA